MTIKQFCNRYDFTEDQFYGREEYTSSLDLSSLTSIPEGFNPTVGGSLDLSSLTSIPEGFNPTVGGSLYLSLLTSIPEGFNPTVGGDLYLSLLTSIPEGFNPTVGGSLDLSSLTSIPEGFNPTVGGSLDLRLLTSIPEGFNPTVGGSLYLSSLTSIPEGFNPTVGGDLYLKNERRYIVAAVSMPVINPIISWENGKYILADDIFCEVISHKGMVYKCRKLFNPDDFYIVEVDGKVAHGKTIKEAEEDLLYKISNRDTSRYQGMKLTDTVSHAEGIELYRVITGACAFGTRDYVENRIPARKAKYTIGEIIKMTDGEYGHDKLVSFFKAGD